MKIHWDRLPTIADQAQAAHEAIVRGGGGAGPAAPGAFPDVTFVVADDQDADPVARLERLAGLRRAGVVTDEQFAQLKAQILGQANMDDA